MQLARQGIITEAMLQVAAQEQLAPEVIRAGVAAGTIAVCCNINHKNLVPRGVGQGLAVKVNANIGTSSAYPDPEPELAKLRAAIDAGADSVMDLSTQAYSTVNAEKAMKSASVIKAFIMAAVYDKMVYPNGADTASEEYEKTLKPLLTKMITVSDNDAANELVRQLGNGDFAAGAAVVNEFCQEREYTSTHLGREFLANEPTDDNYVSASDCCRLLSDIYNGTLVNEKADSDMLELLKGQTVKTKIPVGVPDGIETANKTGELSDAKLGVVENDIAIVFDATHPYVIAVLSNDVKSNADAQNTIAKISKDVYEFMTSQK